MRTLKSIFILGKIKGIKIARELIANKLKMKLDNQELNYILQIIIDEIDQIIDNLYKEFKKELVFATKEVKQWTSSQEEESKD